MKLTNVTLHANGFAVATLNFRDSSGALPYTAKNILGLDSDEIVPNFSGFGKKTGQVHRSPKLAKRELVIWVSLEPRWSRNETYSNLRDNLYRAIAASRTGELEVRFNNGLTTVAAITGLVTKFESPHFTKTPEAQITLECKDPMLRGITRTAIDTLFLSDVNSIKVEDSTAPHGLKFNMTFTGAASYLTLKDATDPEWTFTVTPVGGFLVGDVLWFSSEDFDRYLYIWREPETPVPGTDYSIHLIDRISIGSSWPKLFPGANPLLVDTDGTYTWDSMSYLPTYWGV